MQRLISAITALSVALYIVPPFAVMPAQAEGTTTPDATTPVVVPEGAFTIELDGQTVICLTNKTMQCPDGAICAPAIVKANCEKNATKVLAKRAADAAIADSAKPATDQAAADKAAADKAATDKAATDQAAADKAAADQAAADQAAADQAAADQAAADQAAADQAAADQAAADKAAADQAAADKAAADKAAATQVAPAQPAPKPAGVMFDPMPIMIGDQTVICLPMNKSVKCDKGALCVRTKAPANCQAASQQRVDVLAAGAAEDKAAMAAAQKASDAAAKAAEANGQKLVDAPKPTEQAVKSLDAAVTAPDTSAPNAYQSTAAAAAATTDTSAAPADAVVTEKTVTAADNRSSYQTFAPAPATTADGKKKTGLSDLEKVGLVALGALVVGAMLQGNKEVVSNTGDRVVVKDPQGNYQVYKDDDVLLRQPGSDVRTETFNDGSTRTTVKRDDGTSVVTVRDASGRVLRRTSYDARGIETVLIDDTTQEQPIDVSQLPAPAQYSEQDPELTAALAAVEAQKLGRKFSLRQIRTIPEVKSLAAPIPVENVTFETGSPAIRPDQAENLAALGAAVKRMIHKNPNRIFLIEGHTDAVGTAPSNLVLSDRRAESVAKALSEYFGVPPENLVVQGYGEGELLVDTQAGERLNRRVVVRDITPLLRQADQ